MTISIVLFPIVLFGIVTFYGVSSLKQSAAWIAQTLPATPEHPQRWRMREIWCRLLWAPRQPSSLSRWIRNTALIAAWLLAERALWPRTAWDIGLGLIGLGWFTWDVQYIRDGFTSWTLLSGFIRTAQPYAHRAPRCATSPKERTSRPQWWHLTLDTLDGPVEIVTPPTALYAAHVIRRLQDSPPEGSALHAWWKPARAPVVWFWFNPQGNRFQWMNGIIYGFPLLFVFVPAAYPLSVITRMMIVMAVGLALALQWRQTVRMRGARRSTF
jgi:hypothetical protein